MFLSVADFAGGLWLASHTARDSKSGAPREGGYVTEQKKTRKPGTFRTGSFREFKDFTLSVVRGQRKMDLTEPKIWVEMPETSEQTTVLSSP